MNLTADLSLYGGAYDFPVFRILGPRKGQLKKDYIFYHGVTGFTGRIGNPKIDHCEMLPNGFLIVYAGFEWDYASGGVDTLNMVVSSLAHDALCRLTNRGVLPWEVREKADEAFRRLLKSAKAKEEPWTSPLKYLSLYRRWQAWAGVRLNSSTRAKWRRRK